MSTSGITSSLLAQIASSPSASNRFVTDLNQLAKDLKGDNLSAAQQDFVTLSQDALNGATSATATTSDSAITTALLSDITSSSNGANSFESELNQLGTDLQNGDLSSAQSDMLSLDSTALNAAPSAGSSTSGTAGSTASSNQAETTALIHAIVQAMDAGDNSAVGTAMSQLASISPSSEGASYLTQDSASYGSSSSSSISQLLQSVDSGSSSSSLSSLSLLA